MDITPTIVNRTPHEVVVLRPQDGAWDDPDAARATGHVEVARYPSVGEVRAKARRMRVDAIESAGGAVPVFSVSFGELTGLPDPQPGVFHIVSRIAAEAALESLRPVGDLLIPDGVVRGPDGQPIGCCSFSRL